MIFTSLSAAIFSLCLAATTPTRPIEVQGHRGARAMRPENTLPAFQYALEAGVDTLELDLAVTSDGELVISHDPAILPVICLDPQGQAPPEGTYIHTLTLEQVQKYDCGTLRNPRFITQVPQPHTPIPAFRQLLQMLKNSNLPQAQKVQLNIETKIFPSKPELTPTPEEFIRKIVVLLREYHVLNRAMIQSFDDRTLRATKRLEPRLRTVLLTSDNHLDYLAAARSARVDIVSPDFAWLLPEDVQRLHRAHIKVIPWTVNEPADWERMLAMGVDGLITDRPQELLRHLHRGAGTM